ncbi:nicotinamide riboside transporter PnuC [Colwellia sp. UCD-KL20]|uniref:nicotinamide riboside transporter PnuC n=1 Tax=Colwellia sp. UCD-KL20 TaxID=1917165 RepID=UPI000970E5AC|nr:nicotinamide riboside transporter PnuC [Colwellia sp. UCD-KL20]
MENIIHHYLTLPLLEVIAVIASLLYVVLAAKKNIWCWPAAFISTVIYTFLFYKFYLWMDSFLQVYYMGMAFYGWYCWNKPTEGFHSNSIQLKTYTVATHLISIVILSIISLGVGWFMDTYTPTDFPYLDSTTTVFSVFSTYLVAQKVIENWLYWIVIDAVSIYLYVEKGLTPTAFLFAVFILIAAYGYYIWRQEYKDDDMTHSEVLN